MDARTKKDIGLILSLKRVLPIPPKARAKIARARVRIARRYDKIIAKAEIKLTKWIPKPKYRRFRAKQGENTFEFHCRAYTEFLRSPLNLAYFTFAGKTSKLTRNEVAERGKFLRAMLRRKADFTVEDFVPLIELELKSGDMFLAELEKIVNPSFDAMRLLNLIEKEMKKRGAPVT